MDPAAPNEFALRGRARLVDAPDERARVAAGWAFEVDDSYTLFEFSIEHALLGARADGRRLAAALHLVARYRLLTLATIAWASGVPRGVPSPVA